MEQFTINKIHTEYKVVVIGVGLSGAEILEHVYEMDCNGIEMITIQESYENYSELEEALIDADLVFITTGLNDQMGMERAHAITKIAKETDALIICVIPKSYCFENRYESKKAKLRLSALEKVSDMVIHPNIHFVVKEIRNQPIIQTLSMATAHIIKIIKGTITPSGPNDITIDIKDIKKVLQGTSVIEIAEGRDKNAAFNAMNSVLDSLVSSNMPISDISGVYVNFKIHPDYPLIEINDAMQVIEKLVKEDVNIVFGTTADESLELDYVHMTLTVSNYIDEKLAPVNNI